MKRVMVAALVMVACGGGDKKVEGPTGDDDVEDVEDEGGGDDSTMVSQEVLDGIQRTFEKKVTILGRCFAEGMEAGELTKRDKVIITVSTTIQPDGSATGTTISKTNTGSEAMKACVIRKVSGWTFPAPPENLPFSHVYRFEEF